MIVLIPQTQMAAFIIVLAVSFGSLSAIAITLLLTRSILAKLDEVLIIDSLELFPL